MSLVTILFFALATTVFGSPVQDLLLAHPGRADEIHQFQEFQVEYDRKYSSKDEMFQRFELFSQNLKDIERWNREAEGKTVFGVTKFSDWTKEERQRLTPPLIPQNLTSLPKWPIEYDPIIFADDNWDWRVSGIVTGVKDQGSCGSCWAFSTVAVVESANAKAGRGLITLAEQQMVDCVDGGCNGGVLQHAMGYAQDHGLPKESDYPYHASQGQCHDAPIAVKATQMYEVGHSENEMRGSVHDGGPLSFGVSLPDSFQNYRSGVYGDTNCNPKSGHGMAIVGYGNDAGDYWIVKNSWGQGWGDQGYIKIRRGINWCGITDSPVAAGIW